MSDVSTKADCYSASERSAMAWGQNVRAVAFAPLIWPLAAAGVTADAITGLSLVAGLAYASLAFYATAWALVALALHVLLDGLDGPLARQLGTASRRGSFTDTTCDQIVVSASTFALIALDKLSVASGGTYVFLYALVVAFAMVRNAMGIPYSWVIRPRFLVYAFMAFDYFQLTGPNALEVIVWLCNVVLFIKFVTGFVNLRRSL